jgi:hypothetical protein
VCDENHEGQVEARIQALQEAADNDPPERIRPCNLQKLITPLKLSKVCGNNGILNECLRCLARIPLANLTHLIN